MIFEVIGIWAFGIWDSVSDVLDPELDTLSVPAFEFR